MKKTTILEGIQKEIDRCNCNQGCLSCCSLARQEHCSKLRRHTERIEFCIKNNLPVEKW